MKNAILLSTFLIFSIFQNANGQYKLERKITLEEFAFSGSGYDAIGYSVNGKIRIKIEKDGQYIGYSELSENCFNESISCTIKVYNENSVNIATIIKTSDRIEEIKAMSFKICNGNSVVCETYPFDTRVNMIEFYSGNTVKTRMAFMSSMYGGYMVTSNSYLDGRVAITLMVLRWMSK